MPFLKRLPSSILPRLLSTSLLWGFIAAVAIFRWEVGYWLLIGGIAITALCEYFWLLRVAKIPRHWFLGCFGAVLLLLGNCYFLSCSYFSGSIAMRGGGIFAFDTFIFTLLIIALFCKASFNRDPKRSSAEGVVFTFFGVAYIPWLFSFLLKLIYLTPKTSQGILTGPYYVIFLLVVTKFTDVGAFLFGSLFGKHPFFPQISPNKTWEGLFGALLVAILSGEVTFFLLRPHLDLLSATWIPLISLLLGAIGTSGDLSESLLKRTLRTKDSGDLLPGIGGGLDLIDSILFTAPLFYWLLQLIFLLKYPSFS